MFVIVTFTAICLLFIWRLYISPKFYMKKITREHIDNNKYCLIDVRDFSTFYRNPTKEAKNIPLSYLPREVKTEGVCDKEVVVIADGKRAARMAARIIKRKLNKQIYYVTI